MAALLRIQELEALLKRHSGNSSRPPSSDEPSAPPRPKQEPSGRKRGGQPGHQKHERELLPPERVRSVSECLPRECRGCGDVLDGIDPNPQVHQVFDIPRLIACADEFRLHSLYCTRCGITTQGQVPKGVPTTGISPRFEALIGMLSSKYRLSKRAVQEMCADVFDVDIALGSVCNAEERVSESIAVPVAEAHEAIKSAPVVHADETGWREAKHKA